MSNPTLVIREYADAPVFFRADAYLNATQDRPAVWEVYRELG